MNNDRRLLLLVVASLLLAAIVTAALPQIVVQPNRIAELNLPTLNAQPSASDGLQLVVLGMVPIFLAMIVLMAPMLRSRRAIVTIVVLVVTLVFLAWSVVNFLPSNFVVTPTPTPTPNILTPEPTLPPELIPTAPTLVAPDPFNRPPNWVALVISLVFSLLLTGGGLYLVWRTYLRRRTAPTFSQLDDVGREAGAALEALQGGEDLRNVVMRCYADMARALAQSRRINRDATMTPSEFADRLIALGLPAAPVEGLTHLFEAVRYGSAATSAEDEQRAVETLSAIVAAIQAGREAE